MLVCAGVLTRLSAQDTVARKTVREAVYTEAQAARGKQVYEANCITCHLADLDGSANPDAGARGAPLVGSRFVQDFGESKVSALFNKMKRDMPSGRPGTLTDQEYLDATSYVLQRNRFPAGATELTEETAGEFWIPGAGGAEGLANYTFVTTVGCLHQDPTRSWLLTNAHELKKTDPTAGTAPALAGDGRGEFTFRLLDAISYNPDPHNGHKVRVTGHMVRLGAEIRVNVQSLHMVGTSCGN
jgi:mono/diheme cytochrome c family protein